MLLAFDIALANGYRSKAQRARRLTEGWLGAHMYCVGCGAERLDQHPNNARANDFFCATCGAQFELKSKRAPFGATVPDGAYETMSARLTRPDGGPHLLLLHYCPIALATRDLDVVAASFLTPQMIIRRPPLGQKARRKGWIGCNIRVGEVPPAGRITVVKQGALCGRSEVLGAMQRAISNNGSLRARTWFVDTLRCIERLPPEFTIQDVYGFEAEMARRHPGNQHVRDKLRQQLQRLRDAGLVKFLGAGRYLRADTSLPGYDAR